MSKAFPRQFQSGHGQNREFGLDAFDVRGGGIRSSRGVYLLIKRGKISQPDALTQFRNHVVSLWTFGVELVHHIRINDPDARDAAIKARLTDGFGRLRR